MPDFIGGNQIALGTKQYLLVSVIDIAGQVSDLSGTSPEYTVWDENDDPCYTAQAAVATEMVVYCLIDTTVDPAGPAAWIAGKAYRLWVGFTIAPEDPYLGPFDFYLI